MIDDRVAERHASTVETERRLLGVLIIVTDNNAVETCASMVTARDFLDSDYAKVYSTIIGLWRVGKPIDLVTIKNQHPPSKDFTMLLSNILEGGTDGFKRSGKAEHYASIVREQSRLRSLERACSSVMHDAATGLPYADCMRSLQDAIYRMADADAESQRSSVIAAEGIASRFGRAADVVNGVREDGIRTGIAPLDKVLGVIVPPNVVVVGASPGTGKTTLGVGVARAVCSDNESVALMFSMEMGRDEVLDVAIAAEACVDSRRIKDGNLNLREWDALVHAALRVSKMRLIINDSSELSPADARAHVKAAIAKYGKVDLIVVDYLQLQSGDDAGRYGNRNNELAIISRSWKVLAKNFGCAVLLLSQLKRTDGRPGQSDLRDSGAIEADADKVLLLYRPGDDDGESTYIVECIVPKNRNGPRGRVDVAFAAKIGNLWEMSYE